jgi:hypothetical protein
LAWNCANKIPTFCGLCIKTKQLWFHITFGNLIIHLTFFCDIVFFLNVIYASLCTWVVCEINVFRFGFLLIYKWITFWITKCALYEVVLSFVLCLWTMIGVGINLVAHDKYLLLVFFKTMSSNCLKKFFKSYLFFTLKTNM